MILGLEDEGEGIGFYRLWVLPVMGFTGYGLYRLWVFQVMGFSGYGAGCKAHTRIIVKSRGWRAEGVG